MNLQSFCSAHNARHLEFIFNKNFERSSKFLLNINIFPRNARDVVLPLAEIYAIIGPTSGDVLLKKASLRL